MFVEDDCSESPGPDGIRYPILFSECSLSGLSFTLLFHSDHSDPRLPLIRSHLVFPLATADTDYSADNICKEILYCDAVQVGKFMTDSMWEEHNNVEGHQICFKPVTGAQANTLPPRDHQKMQKSA